MHKQLVTHGCISNIVATDALVLNTRPSVPTVLTKYALHLANFIENYHIYSKHNKKLESKLKILLKVKYLCIMTILSFVMVLQLAMPSAPNNCEIPIPRGIIRIS